MTKILTVVLFLVTPVTALVLGLTVGVLPAIAALVLLPVLAVGAVVLRLRSTPDAGLDLAGARDRLRDDLQR